MPIYLIDKEIPYYKAGFWTQKWSQRDGCKPLDAERISAPAISMNKPPPLLPGTPGEQLAPSVIEVPSFDIQEIPDAMRAEYMPVAAKLMERWFADELNYAPTSADGRAEKNQKGESYPPSMYDAKTVPMNWALGFKRAKEKYLELIREGIYRYPALEALKKYCNRTKMNPRLSIHGADVEAVCVCYIAIFSFSVLLLEVLFLKRSGILSSRRFTTMVFQTI